MKRVHNTVRKSIFKVLDIFYPLFRKWMPLQTYHYAACGGGNTVLSLFLYFIGYNYILKKQIIHFGSIAVSPHVMALIISSIITLPIGFYLSMFVVFQGSYLRRRIQFFRYFLVVIACLLLNYIFLKIFVEVLGWYPTVSQMVNTCIVVSFSYLSQRHFSFKVQKAEPAAVKN